MDLPILNLENQSGLIRDVYLHPLKVNRDESGILVETLKTTWPKEIYHPQLRPFAQQYYSITPPGLARDEDRWHLHKLQEDRFLCPRGDVVVALYDGRQSSPTFRTLNLFELGEGQGDDGQYILLIPKEVLHGFMAVGEDSALLLNFPTQLYNKEDEGRIPYDEVDAKVDWQKFSWDLVRNITLSRS